MNRCQVGWILSIYFGAAVNAGEPAPAKSAAERGRDVIFTNPLNPPLWSMRAQDEAWKQWGLAEKPGNYEQAFRERYGLNAAPFENHGLPLGLMETRGLFGKGVVNNCLLCHAGVVAGQAIIGVGNAGLDLQGMFDELNAADGKKFDLPFQFSSVRGTIDPVSPVAFLMTFRDEELNLRKPVALDYFADLCSRPPAWWQIKRKKTRDWTGGVDARSTRVDMANLLNPFNSGAYIRQQAGAFADISAYLLTIEAPKYPFPVEHKLAAQGRELFVEHCAKCHGTYGPDGKYPNKIVPLETLGTDPVLAEAISGRNLDHFNKSWLAQETTPEGEVLKVTLHHAYQAPPLDGVWATAPYFHNASVPTLYHVLNSAARPKVFTRSYRTGKEDYDTARVGWKFSEVTGDLDSQLPAIERRKIYDTTQRGRGNSGHTFGDRFTEDERRAVIEYLKTL